MKKKILFNNLSFIIKKNKQKLLEGISKTLSSNYFILGPQVQKFEKTFFTHFHETISYVWLHGAKFAILF